MPMFIDNFMHHHSLFFCSRPSSPTPPNPDVRSVRILAPPRKQDEILKSSHKTIEYALVTHKPT